MLQSYKFMPRVMKVLWQRAPLPIPTLHYSGHELVRLKHVEKIMVTANSASTEAEVQVDEDVEDYDYDNAGDAGDYCPGIEGQEDAYGDGEERAVDGLGGDEAMAV